MRALIRTDSSVATGAGHTTRCLVLAEELARRDADVRFACRRGEGDQIESVRARGFEVHTLPDFGVVQPEATIAALDAAETAAIVAARDIDLLVVDHYGLDLEWEHVLRRSVSNLLVLEDLEGRQHDCSVLLDQNPTDRTSASYRARLPAGATALVGPRFALLAKSYRDLRLTRRAPEDPVLHIVVSFGASDPLDLTAKSVEALLLPQFADLRTDVVIGANYRGVERLKSRVGASNRIRLVPPQPQLTDLLQRADLAIGAGGVTALERLCLGLPSLVICMAENQRPGCEWLSRAGAIDYLGPAANIDVRQLAAGLQLCRESAVWRAAAATAGRRLVDGYGALRVTESLLPTPKSHLSLRRAELGDLWGYFHWVNDPEVRRQSLQDGVIAPDQHARWFEGRLSSVDCRLFVLMAGDLPVGQIRFEDRQGEFELDYSIDATFRGRGWGRRLVELGLAALGDGEPVRATVRRTNPASAAVFERLGFREDPPTRDRELRVFRRDPGTEARR